MNEVPIRATAKVRLIKYDEAGNVVEETIDGVELTEKEAMEIWHSQQQE